MNSNTLSFLQARAAQEIIELRNALLNKLNYLHNI
jgi:hypothetical protein